MDVEKTEEEEARRWVRKRERKRESRAAKHCSDWEATPPERRQTAALCLAVARTHARASARAASISYEDTERHLQVVGGRRRLELCHTFSVSYVHIHIVISFSLFLTDHW